jgi:hypothetical protein
MSRLCNDAFRKLYPNVDGSSYNFELKYSRAFKSYNANVHYLRGGRSFTFKMAYEWKSVDDDIQIGMLQHLMLKLFKFKADPQNNIEFYESFMRHVHKAVPKTNIDPILRESFERVNDKYFFGVIEIANLVWGTASRRRLGHYQYGNDTITVSSFFKESPIHLLDYIMYHEMLHKKHKFKTTKGGKSLHHSAVFRRDEKLFEGYDGIDRELNKFLRFKRVPKKKMFGMFFS